MQIREAVSVIQTPFVDFGFVGPPERAHAIAHLIVPFMLLTDTLLWPALGTAPPKLTEATNESRMGTSDYGEADRLIRTSIPAQQKLLREYAAHQKLTILREFVDVETAKQAGRGGFGDMLVFPQGESRLPDDSRRENGPALPEHQGLDDRR